MLDEQYGKWFEFTKDEETDLLIREDDQGNTYFLFFGIIFDIGFDFKTVTYVYKARDIFSSQYKFTGPHFIMPHPANKTICVARILKTFVDEYPEDPINVDMNHCSSYEIKIDLEKYKQNLIEIKTRHTTHDQKPRIWIEPNYKLMYEEQLKDFEHKVQILEDKIEELECRPPELGGKIYQEAQNHFNKS